MTECCKNCKWYRGDACRYCNLNKPTSSCDWCIGFVAEEDISLTGTTQIKYIDGTSETVETIESEKYHKHYIYDKTAEMFVVFTNKDDAKAMMLPREFVKSIKYIEVE